jgi:hypothetical protein
MKFSREIWMHGHRRLPFVRTRHASEYYGAYRWAQKCLRTRRAARRQRRGWA